MVIFKKICAIFTVILGVLFSTGAQAAFDLELSVSTNLEATISQGQSAYIQVSISNASASTTTAYNVSLDLTGLTGFDITSYQPQPSSSCTKTANVISCSLSSLPRGQDMYLMVHMTAARPGNYSIVASGRPSGTITTNDRAVLPVRINAAPVISFDPALNESRIAESEYALLQAQAIDAEEGDISPQLRWLSNVDGPLGTGSTITPQLSPGRHRITAQVADNQGGKDAKTFQLIVGDIAPGTPTIKTIAGNGTKGYSGDGGPAKLAVFSTPSMATATPDGSIYIVDSENNAIRKIAPNGVITTLFRGQMYQNVSAITSDQSGNVYFASDLTGRIQKIAPTGTISPIAGNGLRQPNDGLPAIEVSFNKVSDMAINSAGELFIASTSRSMVYKIDTNGIVRAVAGNGTNNLYPQFGGLAVNNSIGYPHHIEIDSQGNLFIAQPAFPSRILKVDQQGVLTHYAGANNAQEIGDFGPATAAKLSEVTGLALNDSDELLIADGTRVRKINNQHIITTLFGSGESIVKGDGGFAADAGIASKFKMAAANNGDLIIIGEQRLRKISSAPYATDISITASGPASVDANTQATLNVQIKNLLGDPVENIFVRVNKQDVLFLPVAGADFCKQLDTLVECRINTLNANTAKTLGFALNTQGSGAKTVIATVDSYFTDTNPADNSAPFAFYLNSKPSVSITAPFNGAYIAQGQTTHLAGTAFDLEDGNLSAQISWTSSLTGSLGFGGELEVLLPPGNHVITAKVADAKGVISTQQITLQVRANPVVTIVSPTNNAIAGLNQGPITIQVSAIDPEDGDILSKAILTSSIDGLISSPAVLSEGVHTITAQVEDSDGQSASTSIQLTVVTQLNNVPQLNILAPLDGSTITAGHTVTLHAEATDTEDGNLSASVQWSSSIDGAINSPALLSTGIHILTASVTDSGGKSTTKTVQVSVNNPVPYCTSRGNSVIDEWISRVTLGSQFYASGADGGYTLVGGIPFTLNAGSTLTISLHPGFRSSSFTEHWAIWIDLNRNGVFDTNERLFTGKGTSIVNGSITIPVNALKGETRMRVSMKFSSSAAAQPCETFSYGEVEDYKVRIL